MKNILAFLILICLAANLQAQNSIVQGLLHNENAEPVDFANVILYTSSDSTLTKVEYTNADGAFTLTEIPAGKYFITFNYLGYNDLSTPSFAITTGQTKMLDTYAFSSPANELDEVTVTAKRPLLELKPDKVVMNVAGSINASGEDALSLLKKAPGVVIDNNDNVNLLGKSGVKIYIDGKPSPLSGSDLANYLRTISSDQIDIVEIITNPSAKYEAEGSAGIINIKFLKNKNHGANGNLSSSYAQGIRSRSNINFNGNYRNEKFYAYTSTGAYQGANYNNNNFYRLQSGLVIDQRNRGEGYWKGYHTKLGLDHFINDKHTVGVQVNYSPSKGEWDNSGDARISQENAFQIDSILVSESLSDWSNTDWSTNFNYKYEDKSDRSLNLDLDYSRYSNMSEEDQPNYYFDKDSIMTLSQNIYFTESPTDITLASMKIDYEQNLLKGKVGVGVKYTSVGTDNTFNFSKEIAGIRTIDPERSNQFDYTEKVAAGYINYSRQIASLGIQLGLRAESTNSLGTLTAMLPADNQEVNRKYLDFFPNLGLSYQLNEKNSFNLSYSRRLNRPSYQDLNPFTSRIDELTFEQGNPFLNPEYSNNVQFSHTWNYKINTSLGYTHTSDLIARIIDKKDEKTTSISWLNLEDQKSYSLNISSPLPLKEWWNTYTSLTGVRTSNTASFEDGKNIDLSVNTFNIYNQHSFTLPKNYAFEISGWYSSPSLWEGNVKMNKMYSFDCGVQKAFLDDRLKVKLGLSDIFATNKWSGQSDFGGVMMRVNGDGDNRRVKLNVSYRFGNDSVKSRKRKTGLEEEKGRIKSDN